MSTYDYRPLDPAKQEVRLLDILPFSKRPDDLVSCTLRAVSLDAGPAFETISYCWGDPDPCCSIILDGKILMVPQSTDSVLRCVSDPEHARTVWIDAVCINQMDLQERTQQVMLMGQIYFFATSGIVYLGEGDHDSARALANLEDLACEVKGIAKTPVELKDLSISGDRWFARAADFSRLRVTFELDALTKFFASPWSRRLWITQEAVLPAHSECLPGGSKISLDSILTASAWLVYHTTFLPLSAMNIQGIVAMQTLWHSRLIRDIARPMQDDGRKKMPRGELLCVLINKTFESVTFDERDRVFGLLGLTEPECRLSDLVRLDYAKSLAEVMRDATKYIINFEDSFGLHVVGNISYRSQEDITEPGWPSWVPRLDRADWVQGHASRLQSSYSNSGNSEAVISCDNNVLRLRGYEIGIVDEISDVLLKADLDLVNVQQAISSIHRFVDTAKASDIALRRTLLADFDWNQTRCSQASYAEFDAIRVVLAILGLMGSISVGGHQIEMRERADLDATSQDVGMIASRYLWGMKVACTDRRFAKTTRGHYALVPKVCMRGDIIIMVPACSTPVALRPLWTQDGGRRRVDGSFMLGQCYLDGHMWPEDVERVKQSGRPLHYWDIL